MDKCTHEVRMEYWKNIIIQCQNRPEGQSAKQWLKDNNMQFVEKNIFTTIFTYKSLSYLPRGYSSSANRWSWGQRHRVRE